VTGGPGHAGVIVGEITATLFTVVGEMTAAFFTVVVEAELDECELLLHAAAMHTIPTAMTRMKP